MPDKRTAAACDLPHAERLEILGRFFSAHPGTPGGPPGLGAAALDFVAWLGQSGRLDDSCGSPWWRTLNGALVLDLADALVGIGSGTGSAAWLDYAAAAGPAGTDHAQTIFWQAHQTSLHAVIPSAHDLLAAEPVHERDFIACAIEIVDLAALRGQPTDTEALGLLTERLYPRHYPLAEPLSADLCRLRLAASKRHAGPRVGLGSEIWGGERRVAG
ncbi:MAG: hypothetical protein IT198_15760 [Acidimicrobiia bacterium]|nr:hypothetical protein [Acidimicrobiia bacterium]